MENKWMGIMIRKGIKNKGPKSAAPVWEKFVVKITKMVTIQVCKT